MPHRGAAVFLTDAMCHIFADAEDVKCSLTKVNQNKVFQEYMRAVTHHESNHGINKPKPTIDLLEVYAYQNSRITNWVRSKGGIAMRFG